MQRKVTVLRENPPPVELGTFESGWGRRKLYTRDSYTTIPWITTVNKYPMMQIVDMEQALALARLKIALGAR